MQRNKDRVAVFVDGANMFYAQRALGWHVDFKRVLAYCTDGRDLYNAFYYTGMQVPPIPQQRDFLTALRHLGWTIREKAMKEVLDPQSQTLVRHASLEIEMVVDLFTTVDRYDVAVLLSGDGDFERAVELLRSKGKGIVGMGAQGMVSPELENACDRYIRLETLRGALEKRRTRSMSEAEAR